MPDPYYRSAVGEAICEYAPDAWNVITDEQFDQITEWIENAIENYSLGSGSWAIPDPAIAREEELQKEIDSLRAQLGKQANDNEKAAQRKHQDYRYHVSELERQIEKAQQNA